jgi:Skp family chaperone for outer membrane proteins
MKNTLRIGGLLVVVGTALVAGRSLAETKPAPARAKTRVALVNLQYVIYEYDKYKQFKEEAKKAVKPYQNKDAELKEEAERLTKELQNDDLGARRREKVEARLKEINKAMEANKAEAKTKLGAVQEKQLPILFGDVQAATARYAKDNELDLVMHYNDEVKEDELTSPKNIVRKMQAGAAFPLYVAPGIDISEEIVAALNKEYRRNKKD